ncbi:hypothetical protein VVR12_01815 [Rothia sp. LK2588]|uniref:hypothetical protein n=1 Tax=Rothia sp. LK2588 TaxID=3114369 RepID=UPI0034CD1CDA
MAGRSHHHPKILGVYELHEEYPYAVEARLIQCGLRWDEAGTKRTTWGDILAVIETEPEDGPIHRARRPDSWHWHTLHYNQLQTIAEELATLITFTGNQSGAKARDLPHRAERPWDEPTDEETTLKGDVLSLDELAEFAKLSQT